MIHLNVKKVLPHTLKQLLFVALCFYLYSPHAMPAAGNVELNISSAPLKSSINELLRQSNIKIVYESRLVDNLNAPALNGLYSIDSALATLLDGTGLRYKRINRNMYVISLVSGKTQNVST